MNNLQLPPADASPAQIKAALAELMRLHPNVMQGVIDAVRGFYPLDAHTLQHMRKLIAHPTMRHSYPKGRDFEQGENYAFARIDEVLADAIEQASGELVEPEPEIPWDALPDWAQWVAMDNDGEWWEYEEEPRQLQTVWENLVHTCAKKTSLIPFTAPDWRTSLRQRPAKTTAP